MISATFYFVPSYSNQEEPSVASFGDAVITGDYGAISTVPSQLFRPVFDLSDMMRGLTTFANDKRAHTYSFEAMDPSFRFLLERRKKGLHLFDTNRVLIAVQAEDEFFAALKSSIDIFITDYAGRVRQEESFGNGLSESLDEFAESYARLCKAISALAIPVNLAIR